jgi:hypothetical protein
VCVCALTYYRVNTILQDLPFPGKRLAPRPAPKVNIVALQMARESSGAWKINLYFWTDVVVGFGLVNVLVVFRDVKCSL